MTEEQRGLVTDERAKHFEELAELELTKELTEKAEAAFFAEAREKVRRKHVPEEELRPIYIDLPSHAPYIRLDGEHLYYPDTTYHVSKPVYDTLKEVMWKAWWSEEQLHGDRDDNAYRRTLNRKISARGVTIDNQP